MKSIKQFIHLLADCYSLTQ